MQRPARNEHLVALDVDPRPQRPELGIDRFGPVALLLRQTSDTRDTARTVAMGSQHRKDREQIGAMRGIDLESLQPPAGRSNGDVLQISRHIAPYGYNLLVCFAPIERYSGDSGDVQQVSYISGGDAYYFSRGAVQHGRWEKASPEHPLRVYDKTGAQMLFNRGKTYLAIVDDDEWSNFSYQ